MTNKTFWIAPTVCAFVTSLLTSMGFLDLTIGGLLKTVGLATIIFLVVNTILYYFER